MPQLPPIPLSFSADLTQQTQSFTNQFGDRQSQRFRLGRRPTKQMWSLRWELLNVADKETLRTFFETLAGVDPFQWTPPGQTTELNFVVTRYKETPRNAVWGIEIDVEQVYYTTLLGQTVLLFGTTGLTVTPSAAANAVGGVSLSASVSSSTNISGGFAATQINLAANVNVSNDVAATPGLQANTGASVGITGNLVVEYFLSTSITIASETSGTVSLGGFAGILSTGTEATATLDTTIPMTASVGTANNISGTLDLVLGNIAVGNAIAGTVDPSINLTISVAVSNTPTGALNWTPAAFGSNLAAWYDFDDTTTQTFVSTAISQITSKASTTRTLSQATTTARPTTQPANLNGRRVALFDSSDSLFNLSVAVPSTPNHTVFLVARAAAILTQMAMFDYGLRETLYVNPNGTFNIYMAPTAPYDNTRSYDVPAAYWGTSWRIAGVRDTATGNTQIWLDGLLFDVGVNSDRGTGTGPTEFSLGSWGDGSGGFLNGQIAEYIEVNGDVSIADKERIEGYLAHKWGLTASLPAGHPYKTTPP